MRKLTFWIHCCSTRRLSVHFYSPTDRFNSHFILQTAVASPRDFHFHMWFTFVSCTKILDFHILLFRVVLNVFQKNSGFFLSFQTSFVNVFSTFGLISWFFFQILKVRLHLNFGCIADVSLYFKSSTYEYKFRNPNFSSESISHFQCYLSV